jgi:DNA-binding response OmpR family regulator
MVPVIAAPHYSPFASARRARILVAEDHLEMRRLVIDALRDDYDVVDVTDGGQLFDRITDFDLQQPAPDPIDIIVTDVRMPLCSGFDIIERLRDAAWSTPVVIMTAFANDEALARAKRLHAVLLDKPFAMSTLQLYVRELLRSRRDVPGKGTRG